MSPRASPTSSMMSCMPMIAAMGLPISWATPAARRPTLAMCSLPASCSRVSPRCLVVVVSSSTFVRSAFSSAIRRDAIDRTLDPRSAISRAPAAGTSNVARAVRDAVGRARELLDRAHDGARERDVREHEQREREHAHVEGDRRARRRRCVRHPRRCARARARRALPRGARRRAPRAPLRVATRVAASP